MRIKTAATSAAVATALAGVLTAALVGTAGPAGAATHATSKLTKAGIDWKNGAKVVAAKENLYWLAAGHQLAAYGTRYAHERADVTVLVKTPLTSTTKSQRITAKRATRELNGFFHTPGLYDVAAGNAKSYAKADWIRSGNTIAANQNAWFAATVDELDSYGKKYASQRADLASLESIPLTNATKKQRAAAHRDIVALDAFFNTPGVNE